MGCHSRIIAAAVIAVAIGGLVLIAFVPTRDRLPPQATVPLTNTRESPTVTIRGFDPLVLIHEQRIQAELGLSDDQRDGIQQLVNEFLMRAKPIAEMGNELHQMPKSEQAAQWGEMNRQREQLTRDFGGKAVGLLLPNQQSRLQQVAVQLRQEELFYQPDIEKALMLTDDQIHRITLGRMEVRREASVLHEKHSFKQLSKEGLRAAIKQLRAEALKRYEAELRPDQQAIYAELRGRPIEFTRDDLDLTLRPAQVP